MYLNPPMSPKPGSKPLSLSEVKEGDILFCTYHPSITRNARRKVARKYLVLKVDKAPWAGPKVTCVVLYAYRHKIPGDMVVLDLPTLPIDSWFTEV